MSEPNKIRKWVVEKFDGISPGLMCSLDSQQAVNCARALKHVVRVSAFYRMKRLKQKTAWTQFPVLKRESSFI